ncbi:MAG TPA: LacI family DNA-binding transcriptional regulator [Acidobacteriaceae bacterium]|nr:LacI family DNA-binding transcriptional regulator [Acidobacteriaceae bacterium]
MDIVDIAKLAGVSIATVSRVINGSNEVRPATAERVRRVVNEVKFVPNGNASLLKQGKSSSYGLIIPDITNPFFPEFIRSFESILETKNKDMLIATTDLHASRMQNVIHRMLARQVNGVALLASEIETEPIETLIRNKVPLVTLDRRIIGRGSSDVSVHYPSGMLQAIAHLKKLRHRRIGYIGGSAGLSISDHREQSFIKAMKKCDLRVDESLLLIGNYRVSGGEVAMAEILKMRNPPTAVMAANDLTAIGTLRVLHREGISVPRDFSIVGFDDIELSDMIFPPLTTIRLSRHELAQAFVDALEAAAKEPHAQGRRYSVRTSLVVRSSTGPARASMALSRGRK